ncbi:S8 family peptidase [Aequorivita sinensis]|uniref:S8 family peptidase n=1 Tax=Aequorivita sinensis TaxID=1382458 RepID=UPI0023009C17|nr:S8 family peptidase [Aequorivita sinensis]
MKKLFLLLVFAFVSTLSFAQLEDALVFLEPKDPSVVSAALADPATILTTAAINRKLAQGIAIDERDVPLNEVQKAQIEAATGITVLAKSKWLNAVYVRGTLTNINNLLNFSFVSDIEYADKSMNRPGPREFERQFRSLQNKIEQEEQLRVVYNYGNAENQTEMIGVDVLHQEDFTGQDIAVAFMDNGYPNVLYNPAYAHMRDEGRLLGYYDFVARVESPNGTGGHGALTLSDAAAVVTNEFVGTAPNASYYLFITEDDSDESPAEEAYWVEALERSDSLGVYVSNTSLGYQDYDKPAYTHQYSDLDGETTIAARGANIAFDKGMITVTSAGNDGSDFGYVGTPADAPGSFTVGAVDANENYVYFSSYGPNSAGLVKPDVMAQGANTAVVDRFGETTDYWGDPLTSNGTSFSSPIIAGAVASLWSAVPTLKNDVVMQAIRESAHLYNNPTDLMGYGIPNFGEALSTLLLKVNEQELQENQFALYPNPVTTEVNISFPKTAENAVFVLYNVLGEKILQTNIAASNNRIDLSNLTSGMYIASITSNNKTTSYKIIKK